jgi:hypothetical protein
MGLLLERRVELTPSQVSSPLEASSSFERLSPTTTWYLPIRLMAPVKQSDGRGGGGAKPNLVRFNRSFFFFVGSNKCDGSIWMIVS